MKLFKSLGDLLAITFLRFRPLARVWAVLLMLVNAASLLFLDTAFGRVALGAVAVGVLIMAVIYMRWGFVRLLGVGHVPWIPMLPWMLSELPSVERSSGLYLWLVLLVAFNAVSLVIDAVDFVRYLRGERRPHYALGAQGKVTPSPS